MENTKPSHIIVNVLTLQRVSINNRLLILKFVFKDNTHSTIRVLGD